MGVVNKEGREVIPLEYDRIDSWDDSIYVKKDKKWGCMNKEGEIVIPIKFGKKDRRKD